MIHTVIVSAPAKRDIAEAAAWWSENRSEEEAYRWFLHIDEKLAGLADDPERYPVSEEPFGSGDVVREALAGLGRRATHRIFFVVTDDVVNVLHIRHVRRRPPTIRDLRRT